jgi:hypothetical protein
MDGQVPSVDELAALVDTHARVLGAGNVDVNAGELIAETVHALEMSADAEDIGLTSHPPKSHALGDDRLRGRGGGGDDHRLRMSGEDRAQQLLLHAEVRSSVLVPRTRGTRPARRPPSAVAGRGPGAATSAIETLRRRRAVARP